MVQVMIPCFCEWITVTAVVASRGISEVLMLTMFSVLSTTFYSSLVLCRIRSRCRALNMCASIHSHGQTVRFSG
jgi:hypothetical protein